MPEPTPSAVRTDGRDQFRAAVAALPAGPLRDVLVAVAYARDAAARTGAAAAPDDRWQALVAAAERAVRDGALDVRPRLVAA
jgi:hypothetical protein